MAPVPNHPPGPPNSVVPVSRPSPSAPLKHTGVLATQKSAQKSKTSAAAAALGSQSNTAPTRAEFPLERYPPANAPREYHFHHKFNARAYFGPISEHVGKLFNALISFGNSNNVIKVQGRPVPDDYMTEVGKANLETASAEMLLACIGAWYMAGSTTGQLQDFMSFQHIWMLPKIQSNQGWIYTAQKQMVRDLGSFDLPMRPPPAMIHGPHIDSQWDMEKGEFSQSFRPPKANITQQNTAQQGTAQPNSARPTTAQQTTSWQGNAQQGGARQTQDIWKRERSSSPLRPVKRPKMYSTESWLGTAKYALSVALERGGLTRREFSSDDQTWKVSSWNPPPPDL